MIYLNLTILIVGFVIVLFRAKSRLKLGINKKLSMVRELFYFSILIAILYKTTLSIIICSGLFLIYVSYHIYLKNA